MAGLPPDVQAEGRRRRSLLSRRRLLEMDHHGARIDHWLAVGLITTRTRGHYIVSGAAVEELGRLLTAIERSGTGARIGGPWACGLHQLEGFDLTGDDHVLVPPGRRVRGVPFTVVRSPVPEIDRQSWTACRRSPSPGR
ncbi:MAG TPA: hypothetical protein VM287_01985 [Egibacteraceae bacterium]|nr:hypothetical protein [Egibacteraceae bacterium]